MNIPFDKILRMYDNSLTLNQILKISSFKGDTSGITRSIFSERKSNFPSKECQNSSDFFSSEDWSESNTPDLIIKFKLLPDLSKENSLCFLKDDIKKWIADPRNTVALWISSAEKTPTGLELKNIDSEGYGGRPSYFRHFIKLPVGGYIIPPENDLLSNEYVAIPFYTKARVGNIYGVFAIGASHGQEPGETIYYLIPSDKNIPLGAVDGIKEEILQEFYKNMYSINLAFGMLDFKIKKLNANDIINIFNSGSKNDFMNFMNTVSERLKKPGGKIYKNNFNEFQSRMEVDDKPPGEILYKLLDMLNLEQKTAFIKKLLSTLSIPDLVNFVIKYNASYFDIKEYDKPFESNNDEYFRMYEYMTPHDVESDVEYDEEPSSDLDLTDEQLSRLIQGVSTVGIDDLYSYMESDNYDLFVDALQHVPLTELNKELILIKAVDYDLKYAKLLLDKGVDINVKDEDGRTALIYATASNNAKMVKYLLFQGADKTIKDIFGKNALDYSTEEIISTYLLEI